MTVWSYWLARVGLFRRTTRAQRALALRRADDAVVAVWLVGNPQQPIQAAYSDLPLPARRVRQSVARLTGDVEGATR